MGLENKAAGEKALRKVRLGLEAGRPGSQVCFSRALVQKLRVARRRLPSGRVALGCFQQMEVVHDAEPCTWSNAGPSGWEST